MKNVILFPDKIFGDDSGARSARFTAKLLREIGYKVFVFTNEKGIDFLKYADDFEIVSFSSEVNFLTHLFNFELYNISKSLMKKYKFSYFIALGGIQKPAFLSRLFRNSGVKTIYLFYINDYFCAKSYAGLESGPCLKCLNGSTLNSLKYNCIESFDIVNYIKRIISIKLNAKEVLNASYVLSYSQNQSNLLTKFGILDSKIKEVPIQFDIEEIKGRESTDGDYFLIFGQPIVEKGFHLLKEIINKADGRIKFKIVFKNSETLNASLCNYGLMDLFQLGRFSVETNLNSRAQILDVVASSRGILLTTIYPSTGEFALMESMLLKKPVVAFDVGAHSNIIKDGFNGFLHDLTDLDGFVKSIELLNKNGILRERLGKNAFNTIQDLLDLNEQVESFKRILL